LLFASSCQVILGIEDPKPARDAALVDAAPDAEPGPDTMPGPDGSCQPITLVAAKVYDPSLECTDERILSSLISLALPAELVTSDGAPGNHCAQLAFGGGANTVACIYKGDFSVYRLAECRSGSTIDFDECGGTDQGAEVGLSPGTIIVTNAIELRVLNGDVNQGRTEVTLELAGTCDPDGGSSACIGWNGFAP
jgi:hypothetical protein